MAETHAAWKVTIATLFPDLFPGPLSHSITGRALSQRIWDLNILNIRDFGLGNYRAVDDAPYGGGAGMVMRADVVHQALLKCRSLYGEISPLFIYMTPKGVSFSQSIAKKISAHSSGCVLLCGHYEGIDERVLSLWRESHGLLEVSMGDYIMTGGEVAVFPFLDACIRLLPGTLSKKESVEIESFESGLLEFPQYTKPRIFENMEVPPVLLSGHHEKIRKWRFDMSKQLTEERRPDLQSKC